jgi:glutamyl-tRNA synthetase
LVQRFSIEKVHKGGAKFDYEKAKWFNHEWIKRLPVNAYATQVKSLFAEKGVVVSDEAYFTQVLELVKDRCTLLADFWEHSFFFFKAPKEIDHTPIKAKWNDEKASFFKGFAKSMMSITNWSAPTLEALFKQQAEGAGVKPGELQLPMRLMLVGGKFGPPVFDIAALLGKEETAYRINSALDQFERP